MGKCSYLALFIAGILMAGCGADPGVDPNDQWASAPEWTTYQGNASHTGFVPVTLTPQAFSQLYLADVCSGTPLNPVTFGNERAYVTTYSMYEPQKLFALSSLSGGQVWEHDFGDIDSVHPAAFDNGKVYVTTGGHEDSFLYAFDSATGSMAFQTAYANQWSRYYAPTTYAGIVYTGGGEGSGVYAHSGTDGRELWFTEVNQYDQWTPAVDETFVYAYTGEDDPKLSVIRRSDGGVEYEIPDANFVMETWSMNQAPVIGSRNNVLAVNGGRLISFDLANREIGWEIQDVFLGQVTLGNGTIYVVNGAQVEARKEADGQLLWSWTPPVWSREWFPKEPMLVTKNVLFVSCEAEDLTGFNPHGSTCAVDLETRQTVWTSEHIGHLALSSKGILIIAKKDGRLAAINVR